MRKEYHIVITEFIKGERNFFVSDTEPTAYSGRLETGDDKTMYYIYGDVNLYPLLCIEIGRAIERKARGD